MSGNTTEQGRVAQWIGLAAAVVGLMTAGWGLLQERIHSKILSRDWIQSDVSLDITSQSALGPEAVLVADTITVTAQKVSFPTGAIWFANRIVMEPDTVIEGAVITLVAKSISGGILRADGVDGAGDGAAGSNGGTILLLADAVEQTAIQAKGGNGALGSVGPPGRDGRNGRCKGFGGYKAAQDGLNGEPGGPGGAAGSGGTAIVGSSRPLTIQPDLSPGNPGLGGPGGAGGRGGRGCTGIGGSQPTRANGQNGLEGKGGTEGSPGRVELFEIPAMDLGSFVRELDKDASAREQILSWLRTR